MRDQDGVEENIEGGGRVDERRKTNRGMLFDWLCLHKLRGENQELSVDLGGKKKPLKR